MNGRLFRISLFFFLAGKGFQMRGVWIHGCGCHRKYKKYYFDLHLMSFELYNFPITFFLQVSRLFFFFFFLVLGFIFFFSPTTVELPNFPPPQSKTPKIERIQLYTDQKIAQTTDFVHFYLQLKKIKRLVCQSPPLPSFWPHISFPKSTNPALSLPLSQQYT